MKTLSLKMIDVKKNLKIVTEKQIKIIKKTQN